MVIGEQHVECPEVATSNVTWYVHCDELVHRVPCLLVQTDPLDQDAVCSITHDRIATADVPGLPKSWRVKNHEYDSMHMPCGHAFHVSTLMLHFLVNDMRCPVCRHGEHVQASLVCVPETVRGSFQTKLAQIQEREDALEEQTMGLELITVGTLEDGMRLVVEIHCADNVTVMSSRLVLVAGDVLPNPVFRAQQSFYRRLEHHLNSQQAPIMLVFRLWHMLLEDSISSPAIPFCDYTRICADQLPTRELARQRRLSCDNVPCAELLPALSTMQTFSFSVNREYMHMLLLGRLQEYLADYDDSP